VRASKFIMCPVAITCPKTPGGLARRVTLPWHGRDLKRNTLASILEQSELMVEEFLGLV
jgi:hypothetical protein